MMFIRCSELESDALAHRGGELVFSIFSVDWELLRKGLIANAIGLFFFQKALVLNVNKRRCQAAAPAPAGPRTRTGR
jgi:hypothetical protein